MTNEAPSRLEIETHLDAAVDLSRALWRALGSADLFTLEVDAAALRALASQIEDHAAAARNIFENATPAAKGL